MIPVQKVLVRYTVTAGVLEYAVPFALYGTGDVNVSWAAAGDTETQTTLAPGSDYSVTVFRDMPGGKVTLADGKVPAGATLAIESAVPLTQELDLSNTATVDTEATEGQLDRMVQMLQQLDDGLSRAVKVNATDSGTPEDLLASLYRARDDAQGAATAAAASEQAAEGSEQAAATSASQAAASEQAAAASAEAADQNRAAAAASAADASQSATAARQSAEAAAGSEDRAAQSAASILGLQVEVSTLDPGLPAGGDYDPETGILHLGIPKGDSGASAIATPTSLGSVMPQTGHEDGLELETDGKLRVRKASASQRGGVLASTTAAANTVPPAGVDGRLDASWLLSGLPLGYIYAWPYSTPMDGSIQINGQLLNRQLYADLFAYAKSHGQVISETEWQEKASQQGGYCNFYSEGDGSTTFRAPKIAPYKKLTMASSDAGKYYEAGLPDIYGYMPFAYTTKYDCEGAFAEHTPALGNQYGVQYSTGNTTRSYDFRASRYDNTYGNSKTVTPESMDWIVCVVAFGIGTNVGSVDVANVMSAVGQVQADVATKLPSDTVHVVSTWRAEDGSAWYRKWSDGFLEQGGTAEASTDNYKVTLPIAFSTTNYKIVLTLGSPIADRKETYFVIASTNYGSSWHLPTDWYACGY